MKLWIIRSFFVGLLLLCAGGWAVSYFRDIEIWVGGHYKMGISGCWGKLALEVENNKEIAATNEIVPWFEPITGPWDDGLYCNPHIGYPPFMGFKAGHYYWGAESQKDDPDPYPNETWFIDAPFWFLAIISAAFLWLAWRKTRPRLTGRAFPVDVGSASSGEK